MIQYTQIQNGWAFKEQRLVEYDECSSRTGTIKCIKSTHTHTKTMPSLENKPQYSCAHKAMCYKK